MSCEKIAKLLWLEGDEMRSLKNVDLVGEDDHFITVATPVSDFRVNKKFVIKMEVRK